MRLDGDALFLVYTKAGDTPERIVIGTIDLTKEWMAWRLSEPQILLEPEKDYEGASLPLKPSSYGQVTGPVRQLRDPAIFEEGDDRYLLYSVAGELGIAIARLKADGR